MMAKLWAQEIMFAETMEEAKALYERCPRLLNLDIHHNTMWEYKGKISRYCIL